MGRIALILYLLASPVHADVYRWLDPQGQVHFGDRPPGPDAESLDVQPNVTGSRGLRAGEREWLERLRSRDAERRRDTPVAPADAAPSRAEQRRCARYRLQLADRREQRRQGCRASRCARIDRRIAYYRDLLRAQCR